jgi:diguanylate cyclase (GGDEF)-like protein/PAS domain S-box-containing protein
MVNFLPLMIKRRLGSMQLPRFFMLLFFSLFVNNLAYALTVDNLVSVQAKIPLPVTQTQNPTLIVGSEQGFPPFATGMTDETAGGFTVELWKAVAAEAGLKNYRIRVLPFTKLLSEFKAGKIDVMINLAITDEAHKYADFSVPHSVFKGGIFVRKNNPSINSEADLNGKSIIMMKDDVDASYATSKGWNKQLVFVQTAEEGMRLLASGKHDVMLINKVVGLQTLYTLKLTNIKALKAKAGFTQKFAFAVHGGQPDLLALINEAFAVTKANKTYDTIYEKWFGVYTEKEIGLRDLLKYFIPIVLLFTSVLAYFFYRRRAERKQVELEKQATEEMLSAFYELDLVGLTITSPDKGWLRINHCLCKMLEYSEQELLSMTWAELTHPDDLVADVELFSQLLANEIQGYSLEKRFISKTGKVIPTKIVVRCSRKVNGEVDFVMAMVEDITERKHVETQLKLIAKRSQLLMELENHSEQMDEVTFMQHGQEIAEDITGSQIAFIHFVNHDEETIQLVTWSRRTIEHYCHASYDSHYPVRDAGIWADALRKRQAVIFNDYATYPHKHGLPEGHSPLKRLISVPVIENGKVVMLTGVGNKATDFTDMDIESVQLISNDIWRLVQRRRSEKERLIAATAFESQEAMTIADANGLILRVNQAFTDITGYTQAEVIGQNPRILQSGRHDKEYYTHMWESIHSTGTWQGEIWNRRKSGEVYPEYLNITAVKDAGGIITNYVATFTDITQSKADSDEIKNLAFYDPLTQLPNRRLLLDRLNQALAASTRGGQLGALLILDLDHFKTLNDTLGHDLGDLLLQQVAERLAWCVREGDTVARIGGDEFVIILEGLGEVLFEAAANTEAVANKILTSLNQAYQLGSHEYYNSTSIGATLFSGQEVTVENLLKYSDIAMYDAKKSGRNTLRFFDPVMQESINVRADMTRELRHAIAQQKFQLYYQIQVNHRGQPLGAEVLIRWIHRERGMISPFNFIPLAEETGLILPIGQWVLETACAQLKAWEQDAMTRELTLSVNVSAKQFNQPTFVTQVLTTIQKYGINASLLKLELTESIIIENVNHIIITMVALEALGIRFELDDFGTGYSSLQYLKQLPIHQLKIDQSFVRDITSDSSDRKIVRTIIMMANSLGLQVIAEGVETEEQRQILLDNGCTNYQGYLFGKPVPVDEFEDLLRRS